jgi:hypothetical protein
MPKVRNDAPAETPATIEDLHGGVTIARLATSTLLDDLTGAELVALVRLMRAWWLSGPKVTVANRELHPVANTARAALAGLEERGFIRVRHGANNTRTIERRR